MADDDVARLAIVRDDAVPGGSIDVSGVEVVLDGRWRVQPDADGRFVFDAPGPGEHELVATLARQAAGYFSGPSVRKVRAGEEVEIGLLPLPARVHGKVLSDAGVPLAGVSVRLRGGRDASATTDAAGVFRFATTPGPITIAVEAASLPTGYDAASVPAQSSAATIDHPVNATFRVRAQRSVRCRVADAGGQVRIEVPATGATVIPDASGAFIVRGLPQGEITLVVRRGDLAREHRVVVPDEPGRTDDVLLTAPDR